MNWGRGRGRGGIFVDTHAKTNKVKKTMMKDAWEGRRGGSGHLESVAGGGEKVHDRMHPAVCGHARPAAARELGRNVSIVLCFDVLHGRLVAVGIVDRIAKPWRVGDGQLQLYTAFFHHVRDGVHARCGCRCRYGSGCGYSSSVPASTGIRVSPSSSSSSSRSSGLPRPPADGAPKERVDHGGLPKPCFAHHHQVEIEATFRCLARHLRQQ